MNWNDGQPIETAPKDGTEILGCSVSDFGKGPVYGFDVAHWDKSMEEWVVYYEDGYGSLCVTTPEIWWPLPMIGEQK